MRSECVHGDSASVSSERRAGSRVAAAATSRVSTCRQSADDTVIDRQGSTISERSVHRNAVTQASSRPKNGHGATARGHTEQGQGTSDSSARTLHTFAVYSAARFLARAKFWNANTREYSRGRPSRASHSLVRKLLRPRNFWNRVRAATSSGVSTSSGYSRSSTSASRWRSARRRRMLAARTSGASSGSAMLIMSSSSCSGPLTCQSTLLLGSVAVSVATSLSVSVVWQGLATAQPRMRGVREQLHR